MKKNRCVIFGGGGFIGSYLTEALVKNYDVVVYCRGSKKDYLNLSSVLNKITFIKGDLENVDLIKEIIKPGDYVFNLISSSLPITSMHKPVDEIKHHILLHVLFAQTVFRIGIKKYIFASSGGGIYGKKVAFPISESTLIQPMSPHAIAKATIEFYLNYFSKIYNIPHLIYRIGNPYGARQVRQRGFGIITTLISNIKKNSSPSLFNRGRIIRDFIYIDDLIEAMKISFHKNTKYSFYNIGSGKGTSINTIWKILKKLSNTKIRQTYGVVRPIDVDKVVLDVKRFSQEFHWKAKISIEEGLKKTLFNLRS